MTISRQKLSSILRKHGIPASRWAKGRITWNCSDGYDLSMYGFGGKVARLQYNIRSSQDWQSKVGAGMNNIAAALSAEGLPFIREGNDIFVMDEGTVSA